MTYMHLFIPVLIINSPDSLVKKLNNPHNPINISTLLGRRREHHTLTHPTSNTISNSRKKKTCSLLSMYTIASHLPYIHPLTSLTYLASTTAQPPKPHPAPSSQHHQLQLQLQRVPHHSSASASRHRPSPSHSPAR